MVTTPSARAGLVAENAASKEGFWYPDIPAYSVTGSIKTCNYARTYDDCGGHGYWAPPVYGVTGPPWDLKKTVIYPTRWLNTPDPDNDCRDKDPADGGHYGSGIRGALLNESCPAAPTIYTGSPTQRHTFTVHR